ncbi:MAG TPA: GNAT family N-acetyltransferase [Candidatus Thermoplasmatota archaeon]|nr:GNAT family N-acetyltransferase [Candidatus Thermoplasmatota archaeon]
MTRDNRPIRIEAETRDRPPGTPPPTIRRATREDEADVVGLLTRENLENDFEPREFLVAVSADRVVATARLKRFPDGTLELASVATAPSHRGTGLGAAIVRASLDGVEEPVHALALAPGFFERLGFRAVAGLAPALREKASSNCGARDFTAMVWEPPAMRTARAEVREAYDRVATTARATGQAAARPAATGSAGCCAPSKQAAVLLGPQRPPPTGFYAAEVLARAPSAAHLGLGTGDPVTAANLAPGETVVDLGSGPGLDVILAAKAVGPTGRAIGFDMTPTMLDLAREHARAAGVENAEFHEAPIEALPLEDGAADVVVSNCVFNLSPDKPRAVAEAFRILRPGGRFVVSDTLRLESGSDASSGARCNVDCGCVGGALSEPEWRAHLAAAGFEDVEVDPLGPFGDADGVGRAMIRATKPAS